MSESQDTFSDSFTDLICGAIGACFILVLLIATRIYHATTQDSEIPPLNLNIPTDFDQGAILVQSQANLHVRQIPAAVPVYGSNQFHVVLLDPEWKTSNIVLRVRPIVDDKWPEHVDKAEVTVTYLFDANGQEVTYKVSPTNTLHVGWLGGQRP